MKGKSFKNITEKYQSSKCLADTEYHGNMSDGKFIKDTLFTYIKGAFSIYTYFYT